MFKENHPEMKIGKTKFFELKPKQCISVNSRGIHNVCVCRYHSNFKFMNETFRKIAKSDTGISNKVKDHITLSVCDEVSESCFMNECQNCPDIVQLEAILKQRLNDVDDEFEISYQQWLSVDRPDITLVVRPFSSFILEYCHQLITLKTHDYIASQQQKYIEHLKSNMGLHECLILMDFAQNYNHVTQDSIQSQYFNTQQSTLHPVVLYWKKENTLEHKSFVFISNIKTHDTIFVYCVQQLMMKEIENLIPACTNVHYFTDGAASQYKNKKVFYNLMHHLNDFGKTATHHFHATSHGKGPIDGIGGTAKRMAYNAAMRGSIIRDAEELYHFLVNKQTHITSKFITQNMYETAKELLCERWTLAKPIKGTQSFHYFTPDTNEYKHIIFKRFSAALKENVKQLIQDDVDEEDD